nr:phospholipid carrier-dependent glycosyltransferase [Nocardioides perillae]
MLSPPPVAPAGAQPVVPPAGRRARARAERLRDDRAAGWLTAVGVALVALVLRLWRIGEPQAFAFDETYYAKDAWSLLEFGYVRAYADGADAAILTGETRGQWLDEPSMIVHPEVGKWLIALGEAALGMDPAGWRVSAAVAGALTVLLVVRLARRLTGSTLLGGVAGLLLALDGLHLVLSRLALLDGFLALFLVATLACVVADRDRSRARLADLVERGGGAPVDGWGPVRGLLLRPWLVLAGVCAGLAAGTKWTALPAIAVLGVLVWLWSAGARRSFGVRLALLRSAVVDGVPAFLSLVGVGLVVYVLSWSGWLVHAGEYEEHLSATQYTTYGGGQPWPTASEPDASGLGEVTQSLRSLAHFHRDVYVFHAHFLDDAEHTYASSPRGWPLLGRPVGVDAQLDIAPGEQGCAAAPGSDCLRQVVLLGTPAVWWGGAVALLWAAVRWLGARDWRCGLVVVGFLATWLPWFRYDDRPIFSFYAVALLPFVVLALTLAIGRLLGAGTGAGGGAGSGAGGGAGDGADPGLRRTVGVVLAGSYLVLVVLNAAWFWPVWTDELLTNGEWLDRMWFSRWI